MNEDPAWSNVGSRSLAIGLLWLYHTCVLEAIRSLHSVQQAKLHVRSLVLSRFWTSCHDFSMFYQQSGRMPVLEEVMTSRFYCFARKSQKVNTRKYGLSKQLDSRFHRSISENFKASVSKVPWARVGNFWRSKSIKSLSFWKGLRRSRRHFDGHRM